MCGSTSRLCAQQKVPNSCARSVLEVKNLLETLWDRTSVDMTDEVAIVTKAKENTVFAMAMITEDERGELSKEMKSTAIA